MLNIVTTNHLMQSLATYQEPAFDTKKDLPFLDPRTSHVVSRDIASFALALTEFAHMAADNLKMKKKTAILLHKIHKLIKKLKSIIAVVEKLGTCIQEMAKDPTAKDLGSMKLIFASLKEDMTLFNIEVSYLQQDLQSLKEDNNQQP